ncbi:MAG: four helix bundle protein [Dolichospermum sp.]
MGEIRETEHHLSMASQKRYLSEKEYNYFVAAYAECGRMLKGLEKSLEKHKKT